MSYSGVPSEHEFGDNTIWPTTPTKSGLGSNQRKKSRTVPRRTSSNLGHDVIVLCEWSVKQNGLDTLKVITESEWAVKHRVNQGTLIQTVANFSGEKLNVPSRHRLHPSGSARAELFPCPVLTCYMTLVNPLLNTFWHWVMRWQGQGLWRLRELDFNNMLYNLLAPLITFVASGKKRYLSFLSLNCNI